MNVENRGVGHPPDDEKRALAYLNPQLTPAQLDDVLAGSTVMVRASGEPVAILRKLGPIARDAASAMHGWVIDPYVNRIDTAESFAEHIVGDVVDVREQIVVHAVQGNNDVPFVDTAGLGKLGFPELEVPAAAEGDNRIIALVDATAQSLVVTGDVSRAGAIDVDLAALPGDWKVAEIKAAGGTAKAHWQARWYKDDDALEIQLLAPGGATTDAVAALLDECYGKRQEELAQLKDDDPDLLAATAKAQHDLAEMRPQFRDGVPAGEHLAVKAPFHDRGQTEWMWIDVFAWKGSELTGTLSNTPDFVHNVKLGQRVTVKLADVADYLRVAADERGVAATASRS